MTPLLIVVTIVADISIMASQTIATKSKGYGDEEKAQLQHDLIRNYIIEFEKIRQQCSDVRVQEAMSVMKLLVMQRWIVTLVPDIQMLKDILPQDRMRTIDEVNEEIIRDLKENNNRSPVADAMKLYSEKKEREIQELFAEQVATLTTERDDILDELLEGKGEERENIEARLKYKNNKLNKAAFNNRFHSLAKTMAMQSYNIIFKNSK